MMSTMCALMLGASEKRVVAIECFGFLTDFDAGSRVLTVESAIDNSI